MADAVVKTAANGSGTKLAGSSKLNPFSPTGADVNFIEFFWGDFLRNRVVWNDNAAVTSPNLINAPVSFFAAAANGIALAKSELYRDQFGRSVSDYTGVQFSANTQSWANATLKNGLASAGDTYNLFLSNDVTINGDIIPSGLEGVTNNLFINAGSLLSVPGALQNFASIAINTGAVLTIDWKDSAVNALTQNKTLTVQSGTANVVFSGDNDFSKLSSLILGAGTLSLDTTNQTVDQYVSAEISGPGSLRKLGLEKITLSGANTFSGGLTLEEGLLALGASSVNTGANLLASPVGLGVLTIKGGATLSFEEQGLRLLNTLRLNASGVVGEPVHLEINEHLVDLEGKAEANVPVEVNGAPGSVLTFSGATAFTEDLSVQSATVRFEQTPLKAQPTITLRSGGGLRALVDTDISSTFVLEDEGRLDGGEGVLSLSGDIIGAGRLLLSGSPYGTVRLGGLNTYSGGTTVEGTRVEVAVNGADGGTETLAGSGQAFGSGDVHFTNATLAFGTSAEIRNTLVLNGELTIDVAENIGELSGPITDDFAAPGSLYITGAQRGALFVFSATNHYTGLTVVDGTTLRLRSTSSISVLGSGTPASGALLPIHLNGATLQIIRDHSEGATPSPTPVMVDLASAGTAPSP
jgi:fibronectin-binding autotransporter adhesin